MDHMTPADLAWILLGTFAIIVARVAIAARAMWLPVARGLWHRYVANFRVNLPSAEADDPGFANAGTAGSAASERDGTARTPEAGANVPWTVQGVAFEDCPAEQQAAMMAQVAAALEQRGMLVLSPAEQEVARRLVYQTERRIRLQPTAGRSKSEAIERGAGVKRGGSEAYRRASRIYDAVIGQPDAAVVAPGLAQEREGVPA